jgi:hypothetical protein
MKIWTCGISPRIGSRNTWKRIKNVNVASRMNKIWIFFGAFQIISCRAIGGHGWNLIISLWPGDNTTINGVAACTSTWPKFQNIKIPLKIWPLISWNLKSCSSLIIFQKAKHSKRSITHFCCCNWRTFWRKNTTRNWWRASRSCTKFPGTTDTCNPEVTGLTSFPKSWSPSLFSGSDPVGIPTVRWTEIN